MTFVATNPANGEALGSYKQDTPQDVDRLITRARASFLDWKRRPTSERAALLSQLARLLRERKPELARLASQEMGKPLKESEAEVEKSAAFCDYYAERAEALLAPKQIEGGARENYVRYEPIGPVLAVMPWNFPYVQVFRFAPPAIAAGNVALLKHAANVPGCALAIEALFVDAGFPEGVFQTLLVGPDAVEGILSDERVAGVALTGSDRAGSAVAAIAGRELKRSVMELGGSDPFVVLEDADLNAAALEGCRGRNINAGQACIAAKRFIVVDAVADEFEEKLAAAVGRLKVGDPLDPQTDVGPLARPDLVEGLRRQVHASQAAGAELVAGGFSDDPSSCFVSPIVLTRVTTDMPVFTEETFGPVAAVTRVPDEESAIALANDTQYGLGASIWTNDKDCARRVAEQIDAGMVFVNSIVFSDPRLPFGGTKRSGYGRELGEIGILEFVDVKSIALHEVPKVPDSSLTSAATAK